MSPDPTWDEQDPTANDGVKNGGMLNRFLGSLFAASQPAFEELPDIMQNSTCNQAIHVNLIRHLRVCIGLGFCKCNRAIGYRDRMFDEVDTMRIGKECVRHFP